MGWPNKMSVYFADERGVVLIYYFLHCEPQVFHTLLDLQLLLDGPADHLFLILQGLMACPRLSEGRGIRPLGPTSKASAHHRRSGERSRCGWHLGLTDPQGATLTSERVSLSQMDAPRLFIQPTLLSSAIREKGRGKKKLLTFIGCSVLRPVQI